MPDLDSAPLNNSLLLQKRIIVVTLLIHYGGTVPIMWLNLSSGTMKLERSVMNVSLTRQAMASKIISMCMSNTDAEIATSIEANALVRLAIVIMHIELVG